MDLYVLRHGEAGKRAMVPSKDVARPLTSEGKEEVKEVAEAFSKLKVNLGVIATSPLSRAKETASIFAKTLKFKGKPAEWDELKPEGNRTELYKKLAQFGHGTNVMLVGHEPYLTQMIGEMISPGAAVSILLKKSGIARVRVITFNPKLRGELRWLLSPRLIKWQR